MDDLQFLRHQDIHFVVIATFFVMVITSSSCKYADRCVGLILSRIETREIPKVTVSAFIR